MKEFEELEDDKILKEHNFETYQEMEKKFEQGNKRVGVVQATGTGKTYIALQWFKDEVFGKEKSAIYLAPRNTILSQFKENVNTCAKKFKVKPDNVHFLTYKALSMATDEELENLKFDYIVLDEFHGLGAEVRGEAVQKLMLRNQESKILGFSATPIRFLDNKRDMGDELFGNSIVQGISLTEAIETGVLPNPEYHIGVYSYDSILRRIKKKLDDKRLPKDKRELFKDDYEKARRMVEQAGGLKELFAKNIKKKDGKFIAFCSDLEQLKNFEKDIKNGLFDGINKNVKIYKVSYKQSQSKNNKTIKEFDEDDSDCFKILINVDIFDEGMHKNVDGEIFLRPTISPRVYTQQLGRCLSVTDDKNFRPQIFDLVNNYDQAEVINLAFSDEGIGDSDDDVWYAPFTIDSKEIELCEQLRKLDEAISFEITEPEKWIEIAKRIVEEQGNLDLPSYYIDEKTGLDIGGWLSRIRQDYNMGQETSADSAGGNSSDKK